MKLARLAALTAAALLLTGTARATDRVVTKTADSNDVDTTSGCCHGGAGIFTSGGPLTITDSLSLRGLRPPAPAASGAARAPLSASGP